MDHSILKTELTTDPLARGYSGMTDAEAAEDLNTVYRPSTNTLVAMLSYLVSRKHRTNQGNDDTFSPIIGRVAHVARSNEGDDPFNRGAPYTGLDIQHIHACQAIKTLFESPHSPDIDFNDTNLPYGYVEASGAWSSTNSTELKALSDNQVSRAQELGLGVVTTYDVNFARALP